MATSIPRQTDLPTAVDALSELLWQELAACNLHCPLPRPESIRDFATWYLQVLQLLEAHVAGDAGRQAISRDELELMCRCALSGATLREAISLCRQFSAAVDPRAGKLSLREAGSLASFRLDSQRITASSTSSICDIAGLFAFKQLFQWLVGVDLQLQKVCIGPVNREDLLPFLKLFGAPVLAGGQDYALEFPAAVLDMPVVRSAAEFGEFFQGFPCCVFDDSVSDLAEQVAALLSAAAMQGVPLPTQRTVAKSLGLPLSTFRRRLALANSSFQRLKIDCLREWARNLLLRRENPIAEVAARLGYSDVAAFRRAFRRWENCSPGEWRRRHGRVMPG